MSSMTHTAIVTLTLALLLTCSRDVDGKVTCCNYGQATCTGDYCVYVEHKHSVQAFCGIGEMPHLGCVTAASITTCFCDTKDCNCKKTNPWSVNTFHDMLASGSNIINKLKKAAAGIENDIQKL